MRRISKVAVELDPRYNGPKSARVLRLAEDGSYKQVFEGPITPATPWLRRYSKFDFTAVKDPGLYVMSTRISVQHFPIAKVLMPTSGRTAWVITLPEQMDHVSVREGYRVWHGASHLDDGRLAPVVGEQFDGWNQATATDGKYKGGDHIPGMNVGGWYDAGDSVLEEPAQLSVIQSLALAYREFNIRYDELTVDEVARQVEMHRPDGVPDTVQQVKHGAMLILAQFHNIGHSIRGTHEPDLRQYTHLGDAASKTDGRIYDPTLGPDEVKGDYSGRPDDRWIFSTTNPFLQWNAIAALAAAADTLKGWDDALAKEPSIPRSKHGMTRQPIRRLIQRATALEHQYRAGPQELVCWPPLKGPWVAHDAVAKGAGVLRQPILRLALNHLLRTRSVGATLRSDRSGPRLWS